MQKVLNIFSIILYGKYSWDSNSCYLLNYINAGGIFRLCWQLEGVLKL